MGIAEKRDILKYWSKFGHMPFYDANDDDKRLSENETKVTNVNHWAMAAAVSQ